MKAIISILMTILVGSTATAWVSTQPSQKEYRFKFEMNKEVYQYSMKANTYEDAYEKAAQACFTHYKAGRHLSEERGIDIIDVCANPRSI